MTSSISTGCCDSRMRECVFVYSGISFLIVFVHPQDEFSNCNLSKERKSAIFNPSCRSENDLDGFVFFLLFRCPFHCLSLPCTFSAFPFVRFLVNEKLITVILFFSGSTTMKGHFRGSDVATLCDWRHAVPLSQDMTGRFAASQVSFGRNCSPHTVTHGWPRAAASALRDGASLTKCSIPRCWWRESRLLPAGWSGSTCRRPGGLARNYNETVDISF